MSAPRFEWRELVYCDTCNPSRRLERTCAGAVARSATRETATCAECIRKLQSMGYTDAHGPVCACGHPLHSRHELRRLFLAALEQNLRASSGAQLVVAAAYELLRVTTLLQMCEACAATHLESGALELAAKMLGGVDGQ